MSDNCEPLTAANHLKDIFLKAYGSLINDEGDTCDSGTPATQRLSAPGTFSASHRKEQPAPIPLADTVRPLKVWLPHRGSNRAEPAPSRPPEVARPRDKRAMAAVQVRPKYVSFSNAPMQDEPEFGAVQAGAAQAAGQPAPATSLEDSITGSLVFSPLLNVANAVSSSLGLGLRVGDS